MEIIPIILKMVLGASTIVTLTEGSKVAVMLATTFMLLMFLTDTAWRVIKTIKN